MRIYPGWGIVAAAFTILFIAYGAQFSFGILFSPLLEEFGWTRADISGVFGIYTAVYCAGALPAGRLTDRFGPDPERWRWGRVHRLVFPHLLGEANPALAQVFNRRVEAGGGQETVSQIAYDPNDPFRAVWAPCWRMVADPGDPARSRWQAFTGQSGQPGNPHYDDLQPDWLEGRTQPMAGEGPWRELMLVP